MNASRLLSHNSRKLAGALLALGLLGATPTHATLIYSESFNYSSGAINGQGGGAVNGYSGNWANTSDGVSNQVRTGLTYTSGGLTLVSSGNGAGDSDGGARGGNYRPWTAPVGTFNDGQSLWFSALVNMPSSGTASDLRLYAFAPTTDVGNDNGYGLAINSNTGEIKAANGGTFQAPITSSASLAATFGTTMLIVARFDNSPVAGADVITVWVNPSMATEPTTGGVSVSGTFATSTLNSAFRFGSPATGTVDEIRLATTFAEAVPTVPEPASAALLGLAAGGVFIGRRRPRTA